MLTCEEGASGPIIVPHVTFNCQKKMINNQNKLLVGMEKIFVELGESNGTYFHTNCSSCPPGWWADSIGSNCYHISTSWMNWGDSQNKY